MEAHQEDIPDVFTAYREELYQQRAELTALIRTVEPVTPEEVTSIQQLIEIMTEATVDLPLPTMDVKPHFRYLDEQEDIYTEAHKKRKAHEDKKRENDYRIGVNSAISSRATYTKTNVRSLDLGNEQKLSVMQMLRNDRE